MNKKIFIILIILFLPFLVYAKPKTFYDLMKDEKEEGITTSYATSFKDSLDPNASNKTIYIWNATSSSTATTVTNMNNIIFGGICWQMLRTTTTGGVKLIYNGTPVDGKCNNTGYRTVIAASQYNPGSTIGYAGYMYNKIYNYNSKNLRTETVISSDTLGTSLWFADSFQYAAGYTLENPFQVSSADEYSTLLHKYTLQATTATSKKDKARYITYINGNKYYYILLQNGNDYSDNNDSYTYGDSYTKNDNGTYTINNPTTIHKVDYAANYEAMNHKYICKNATNNTCSDLHYSVSTTYISFKYLNVSNVYKFSHSFTYNNGEYTLDDDSFTTWDYIENLSNINKHHYTCFNESGVCSKIYYVYRYESDVLYFYPIENGKNIQEYLDEMLISEDVNRYDSTVKSNVDAWYRNNLLDYTSYIDDVVFCSDRSASGGGFNPDNGSVSVNMQFSNTANCQYETDRFSVSNPKAQLTYPIALPTSYEMKLLVKNDIIRKSGYDYWLMTPRQFYRHGVAMDGIPSDGSTGTLYGLSTPNGIRPSLALKANMGYREGDGSKDNPYIATVIQKYKVDVEIRNETKDLNINLEDITSVYSEEEVTFKVTPIKGFRLNNIQVVDRDNNSIGITETNNTNEYTFIMPSSDVTIIPTYERVSNAVEVEENSHTKEIKIEVNDVRAVVYEDEVRFTLIPEEGYELENIIITDEEGNNIEYHKTNKENEYAFVMPDTDVLIKPIYKKIESSSEEKPLINPQTKRIIGLTAILLLLLSVITIYYRKRKNA